MSSPSDLHRALLSAGAQLGRSGPDLFVAETAEVEQLLAGLGRPRGTWSFADRLTQKRWIAIPNGYDPGLPLRATP